ncbi:hypothetical protein RFI_37835, partial [Reticulomyxa filosa]
HPDIHLCIINQIKIMQTQFNTLDDKLISDRLDSLQYLCISTETLDVVVQFYKQFFKRDLWTYANLLWVMSEKLNIVELSTDKKNEYIRKECVKSITKIALKLNERQLNEVLEFLMDGLVGEYIFTNYECALSIAKIALKLNERQLNKVFEYLMNAFDSGKITICDERAHALATISSQLGGKQLDNALQYFIHRFPSYFYYYNATQFLMKLKEEQLGDVFQCLINRLSDEKEEKYNRGRCAELLGKLSMKWNEKQLNDAFNSLKDAPNYEDYYWQYEKAHKAIIVKLSGKQFYNALGYSINKFNREIAQRLDEKQMNIALNYLMDKLNDKNKCKYTRMAYIQLIKEISNKCNEQQLNEAFNSSMGVFTDKNDNKDVRGECAKLLGTIAVNLNGKYFEDAFQCFTNELKDKSIVTLSKKWNESQLNIAFQCLIDGLKDSDWSVQKSCAESI